MSDARATPLRPAAMLRPREALEALASPYTHERYSSLLGADPFVVDFRCDAGLAVGAARDEALAALATLACPTFALVPEETPASAALVPGFDLVIGDEPSLDVVFAAALRAPLASLALVQLLRLGERLDVYGALVAESLVYATLQAGPEFAAWLATAARPARAGRVTGPAVRVERFGEELVLSLDRPERHNAFSVEIRDALVEGLEMAVADTSIEEIVLRAEGPSFSSGGDLSEFGDLPDPATAHAVRSARSPGRLLAACAERVTARVHGACIGAGVELPAFARRVVAAESAYFQLPELSMGLVPGAGGTASLPRRIGRQRACWFALSGTRIDVETAHRFGLVDEIRR